VEDDSDISTLYQIILEDAGFECISFTDSVKALQEFRPGYYDLILLDIKMPILDGVELCKKIREVDKSIRIIFITASGEFYKKIREERYPELINYNNIKYIQKPIANEELIKVVNTMMYASDTNQNTPLPKQKRNKMEIDYDFSAQ
jgi:DNA-binding response OmpR family regulator